MDVATVLGTNKINILTFNLQSLPDGYAKMSIVVEIRSQSELSSMMNKLQQVKGIYQVARVSG